MSSIPGHPDDSVPQASEEAPAQTSSVEDRASEPSAAEASPDASAAEASPDASAAEASPDASAAEAAQEPSAAEAAQEPSAPEAPSEPSEPAAPPAPTMTSIEPSHGPLSGGTTLTIRGKHFDERCAVRVADIDVPITFEDEGCLRLKTPMHTQAGAVDVRVVNPDKQSEIRVKAFHYDSPPGIASVKPAAISIAGGMTLSILGDHFVEGCTAKAGAIKLATTWMASDFLQAVAPPHAAGVVDLEVSNPDGQTAVLPYALRFDEGPVVTRVTPAGGPLAGGTEVTLHGRGFMPECRVTFFDTRSPPTTYDSDTQIRFVTPPQGALGAGNIRVYNPDGLYCHLHDAFSYWIPPPPRLDSVSPDRAWVTGGLRLTLRGAEFDRACSVQLGGTDAAVTWKNSELLEVIVPPAADPARVDVRVRNPDDQSATLAGGFLYEPVPTPPKLISITPTQGFGAGGLTVYLVGDNFDERTAVRIGEVSTTVRFVSRTQLEAVTPPSQSLGPVAVELVSGEGVVVRTEEAFVYEARPAPRITGAAPGNGPVTGGTRVTIEGSDFPGDAFVRIGRERPKSMKISGATQIEIVTPPTKTPGHVDIEIGGSGVETAVMKNGFRYDQAPAPTIDSVAPNRGTTAGGSELSVAGKNFVAETVVLIGGKPAKWMKVVSATLIEAKTPPGDDGKMVDVIVRNPDGKEAVSKRAFMYDQRYR